MRHIAIESQHLCKHFAERWLWRRKAEPATKAVEDVSFTVQKGELFGLLGPNGAGKTTLVKMLCTLILPSSGQATVAGYPLRNAAAIRAAVGLVVADERSFYWRLTARQNLIFFAAMHQLYGAPAEKRVAEVLETVGMSSWADRPFSHFSSGMKQRIAIARSLLHRPAILFLDEPTRSLDPIATRHLHALLQRLPEEQGVTVFLITHDLAEAEKLCRRVAVMHRGRIRAIESPDTLRRQLLPTLSYRLRVAPLPQGVRPKLEQIIPDLRWQPAGNYDYLHFRAGQTDGQLNRVLDCLRSHELQIFAIEGKPPSLEEAFAHLTADD